jgi:hypothetical protein
MTSLLGPEHGNPGNNPYARGVQFLVEEVLLFGVLVLVKHRLPAIFDRFVRIA